MTTLTFLIIFLVLMALIFIIPQYLVRFHIPRIISVMLVGILIGPHSLNLISRINNLIGHGYPTSQIYITLEVMGYLGLILLMALAGAEVNLTILRKEKKGVVLLSLFSFFIPAVTGFLIYAYFRPFDSIGMLLYASIFASHSVGIVFPVIREMGITRTRFGIILLSATLITDLSSLLLLAVCVQMKRHELASVGITGSISIFDRVSIQDYGVFFFILFIGAIAAYVYAVLRFIPSLFRFVMCRLRPTAGSHVNFFLVTVLLVVFVGELIGVNVIIGSFLAGMALAESKFMERDKTDLYSKVEGIGYGLLVPVFFLTVGMRTDLSSFVRAGGSGFFLTVVTITGLIVTKTSSGWLALRMNGFSGRKALCGGVMTVPQLSATLAAASVGIQMRIMPIEFFNAVVSLSIVTTLLAPILVKLLVTKGNITFQVEEIEAGDLGDEELL